MENDINREIESYYKLWTDRNSTVGKTSTGNPLPDYLEDLYNRYYKPDDKGPRYRVYYDGEEVATTYSPTKHNKQSNKLPTKLEEDGEY